MSSVDAFMRDVAPVDWISVKFDFKGFYYGADLYRIAQVALPAELKMYKQLLYLRAAFGSRSSTIIVYDSLDKGQVTFAAPTNGLPPGHPLCGFLAAFPAR